MNCVNGCEFCGNEMKNPYLIYKWGVKKNAIAILNIRNNSNDKSFYVCKTCLMQIRKKYLIGICASTNVRHDLVTYCEYLRYIIAKKYDIKFD